MEGALAPIDAGSLERAPWLEADEKTISLSRKGEKLGLAYRAVTTEGPVFITGIKVGLPIDTWNQECPLDSCLCVGDQILSVNGKVNARGIVEQMADDTADTVEIRFLRSGPRWHLEGTVADAMDKIAVAVHKGYRFKIEESANETTDVSTLPGNLDMNCTQKAVVLIINSLPTLFLLLFLSDFGVGLDVYSVFMPLSMNFFGNAMLLGAAGAAMLSFIVDFNKWEPRWQRNMGYGAIAYAVAFGWILKCRFYPTTPQAIVLLHTPLITGWLRKGPMMSVKKTSFYKAVFLATMTTALISLAVACVYVFVPDELGDTKVWSTATKHQLATKSKDIYDQTYIFAGGTERPLDYTWDCKDKRPNDFLMAMGVKTFSETKLSNDELDIRTKRCTQVQAIWFLAWATPAGCFFTNLGFAIIALLNICQGDKVDTSKIEKTIKRFTLMLMAIFGFMYIGTSMAGATSSALNVVAPMMGASIVLVFGWVYIEIGAESLAQHMKDSKSLQVLMKAATSDWVRAMMVLGFGVFIPIVLILDMLRQKARQISKSTSLTTRFTSGVSESLEMIAKWRWASILQKVNWLMILYMVMYVGVSKWTYVLLSWLRTALADVNLAVLCLIFVGIGFIMFMLPPVPGVPVYVFGGILITLKTKTMDDIGFWGGVGIATALGYGLKNAACIGQYAIGASAGKSIAIQKMVSLDKEGMRAIEKILKKPGLAPSKVAILIGGPDWPTSVICGVLKVPIFQMLIGTIPIIFLLTPCVLSGAFLVTPILDSNSSDMELWETLATITIVVSGGIQGLSLLVAGYFVQDALTKYSEELREWREEHRAIVELRAKEAALVEAYHRATTFKKMGCVMQVMIILSTLLMVICGFVNFFMTEDMVRPFSLQNEIPAPWHENGLNNNSLTLFTDAGWVFFGIFSFAFLLHIAFMQMANGLAKQELQNTQGTAI
eukprot:gb/GFBE01027646.1/.p1 GENE.gb/GFBE01027646.1/~~gb/GFBE01027646.1/.p1  ORF type:complete len:945 (+),score=219.19 gb/GFBE01027646.1/:1-2835(+)